MSGENLEELRERLKVLEERAELQEQHLQDMHAFLSNMVDIFCNASEQNGLAMGQLSKKQDRDAHRVMKQIEGLKEKLDPVLHHVFPEVKQFSHDVDAALRRKPPSIS